FTAAYDEYGKSLECPSCHQITVAKVPTRLQQNPEPLKVPSKGKRTRSRVVAGASFGAAFLLVLLRIMYYQGQSSKSEAELFNGNWDPVKARAERESRNHSRVDPLGQNAGEARPGQQHSRDSEKI